MAFPLLFHIFYSTLFTILSIILLALLLITPGDAIHQALTNNQLYNVFVVAGCYVLTALLAVLIYASRLYTNRSVLAAIPKTWIPVEKGDVGKRVRKMIVESLTRNAIIAWEARPRVSPHASAAGEESEIQDANVKASNSKEKLGRHNKLFRRSATSSRNDDLEISIPPNTAAWGEITHDGWSSPLSPDLPNLQYVTVILELPHLIEAKAVSLAAPDSESTTSPLLPDIRAVEFLQRPAPMGLRDYISYLMRLGVLSPTAPVANFLTSYEFARFSPHPISEPRFRELMRLFADVLRAMTPLDRSILDLPADNDAADSDFNDTESSIDNDASSSTTSSSAPSQHNTHSRPRSYRSSSSRSTSQGTVRTAPSRRPTTTASTSHHRPSTGPATPASRKRDRLVERSPSIDSFAQTRRPYNPSMASSSPARSLRSTSDTSVIRLAPASGVPGPDDLPYTLHIPVPPPRSLSQTQ